MNALAGKLTFAALLASGLALGGCATQPYGNSGQYNRGYSQSDSYGDRSVRCQNCGVVQEVQQVYTDGTSGNGGTLGAIIGAVAGGVIGNQVGKRNDGGGTAWRIVVRLDDGQYATVTQRQNPGVRSGDYVQVSNGQVYAR